MGNRLIPFLRFMGLGLSGSRAINDDVRKSYSNYNFPNGINIFKLNICF